MFTSSLWNNGLIEFYFNFENVIATKDMHKEHRIILLRLCLGRRRLTGSTLLLCDYPAYGRLVQ